MLSLFRPAAVLLALFTALTGMAYPTVLTAIAQFAFPGKSGGSLISERGKVIGSGLIGQPFNAPEFFWGRPSATQFVPYNAKASGGSNLGTSNFALHEAVKARIKALRNADPENHAPIPVDLVTTSGSGLDPHISPAAAYYQFRRVARHRNLLEDRVRALVDQHVEDRLLGIWGEPRINVWRLNRALARMK
ncbi:MAG: potassium-transporting ATPase subunit KdpC [Cyanobacteria bacterium NC_groundwater_1444_Ag_S-0.65um_54_12]|nr:potassium-transporting ATPase subunit KdpC [Cyanobacteria bacterium NC_groundwater_1444_Ag_S-0.65um_54_12]